MTIESNVLIHCHVDPPIGGHGEPHVVRIGVISILIPTYHENVLFKTFVTSILRKYFEVEVDGTISIPTLHSGIDEHILCSWWDDIWENKRESIRVM